MGPADSEPLLISLAAELEAITGWAAKQPEIWWNAPSQTDASQAAASINALDG
jgi:amidase